MRWTKENTQIVRDLAAKGLSAGQIAKLVEVSRNSIMGLCHRTEIKLTGRPKVWRPKPAKPLQPKPPLPPPLPPPPPLPQAVVLTQLVNHQCRWPLGEYPYVFCGKRQISNSSYCVEHYHISRRQG